MMARVKSEDVKKDILVRVRFTQSDRARLDEDASLAGLTLSELIRRRTSGQRVIANADLVMIRELRRVAGLLKHIHVQSHGAYSEKTASAISDLQLFIRRLACDR
jgi:hypothetical protein